MTAFSACGWGNESLYNQVKPHKGDNNIWYFDTEVYQIVGVARFYIGLANHIKILQAPELEQYVATFVNDNLQE